MLLSFRLVHSLIFIACCALLVTAIFIEPFASMEACPMCMMQRAVFAALGLMALLAAAHHPARTGQLVYHTMIVIVAALGAAIAGRQIWLQHLPADQVPACGPGLEYMLEVFPLLEVIEMAITGTGDCAEVQWSLLGLSIPGWSLIAFVGIALASVTVAITGRASAHRA